MTNGIIDRSESRCRQGFISCIQHRSTIAPSALLHQVLEICARVCVFGLNKVVIDPSTRGEYVCFLFFYSGKILYGRLLCFRLDSLLRVFHRHFFILQKINSKKFLSFMYRHLSIPRSIAQFVYYHPWFSIWFSFFQFSLLLISCLRFANWKWGQTKRDKRQEKLFHRSRTMWDIDMTSHFF